MLPRTCQELARPPSGRTTDAQRRDKVLCSTRAHWDPSMMAGQVAPGLTLAESPSPASPSFWMMSRTLARSSWTDGLMEPGQMHVYFGLVCDPTLECRFSMIPTMAISRTLLVPPVIPSSSTGVLQSAVAYIMPQSHS